MSRAGPLRNREMYHPMSAPDGTGLLRLSLTKKTTTRPSMSGASVVFWPSSSIAPKIRRTKKRMSSDKYSLVPLAIHSHLAKWRNSPNRTKGSPKSAFMTRFRRYCRYLDIKMTQTPASSQIKVPKAIWRNLHSVWPCGQNTI